MAKDFNDDIKIKFSLIETREEADALTLSQVHGADGFLRTKKDLKDKSDLKGDWHWTLEKNLDLGVLVADCTAVLVAGINQKDEMFIAGIHAGWRGTAAGIIKKFHKTVQPKNGWIAWLSPSICQKHFEVGEEVIEALGKDSKPYAKSKGAGKYLLDLKRYQIFQIQNLGGEIVNDARCTYCEPEFVSYRQSGPVLKARQLAVICRY